MLQFCDRGACPALGAPSYARIRARDCRAYLARARIADRKRGGGLGRPRVRLLLER